MQMFSQENQFNRSYRLEKNYKITIRSMQKTVRLQLKNNKRSNGSEMFLFSNKRFKQNPMKN